MKCPKCCSTKIKCIDANVFWLEDSDGNISEYAYNEYKCEKCGYTWREDWLT